MCHLKWRCLQRKREREKERVREINTWVKSYVSELATNTKALFPTMSNYVCLSAHTHTGSHTHTYIYIYIYIVIHRQICFVLSELISVARQAWFLKLGSKPGWLKRQFKILPLSHEEASASEVNLNGYESQLLLFTYIRLTATESSIHMKSLAYTLIATQILHPLESSVLQG